MVQFERVWRCFRCDLASSGLIFLKKLVHGVISRRGFGDQIRVSGRRKCRKNTFCRQYFVVTGVRSRIVPGIIWCNLSVFGVVFDAIWRLLGLFSLIIWSMAPFRDVDLEVKYAFLGAGNAEKTHIFENISWWPGFDLELIQVSYGAI